LAIAANCAYSARLGFGLDMVISFKRIIECGYHHVK